MLVGTAHISHKSAEEVVDAIQSYQPQCICVELDAARLDSLRGKSRWQKLNIQQIIKRKEGMLLLVSVLLANFQRRLSKSVQAEPGLEMKIATEIAQKENIPLILCDRELKVTLLRAWRMSSFWDKWKLGFFLFSSMFEKNTLTEQEIEELKQEAILNSALAELTQNFPLFKRVLLEERDQYLATKIYHALSEHDSAVAVIGAGHLSGVTVHLEKFLSEDALDSTDALSTSKKRYADGNRAHVGVKALETLPPPLKYGKILRITLSLAFGALIISGFFFGGRARGIQNILYWVLANGIFATLGSILALAHPLTIISSFVCAPITSLNPTIGVGFVTALIESGIRKPRAIDLHNVAEDSQTLKGFYRNRITKVLLVFVLSSIGSSIGTFVALPLLLNQ